MRRLLYCSLICTTLLPAAAAFAEDVSSHATAFVHVNVVPMDRERVLRDQTVIVEGDRIVAIGRDVAVPASAAVIDGKGTAYLSPGLADMHTHSETRNEIGRAHV